MEIKRKGLWTFVALTLAVLTIWTVMKRSGMTLADFRLTLEHASNGWLTLAFLSMFGYIVFEGEAVLCILRSCGVRKSHLKGFLYGAADVYFSAITPSATGGQPATAYFMVKDGIPVAVVTATLLVNLVCYNLAIVTMGAMGLILRPRVFLNFLPICRIVIGIGFVVLLGLAFLFFMLLKEQRLLHRAAARILNWLHKLHLVHNPEKWEARLTKSMEEFRQSVQIMKGHRKMWVQAYLLNVMQRASQILVTGCAYRALGGIGKTWKLLTTQCFVVIGSNCVPLPGAMGAADYLMLDGYLSLMAREDAFELQLLSRGIAFYACIIISGITVAIGMYVLKHRKKGKRV